MIQLLLFFSAVAMANGDPGLAGTVCKKQIAQTLSRWEPHRRWRRDLDSNVFHSPTSRIGVWLEIHRSVTGDLEAIRQSPEGATVVRWNPKTCTREVSEVPYHFDAALKDEFDDEHLRRLVKDNARGIIFTWSPHMPLSLKALRILRVAAAKMGMKVFLALDPDADDDAAERAATRANLGDDALRRMQSIEMFQRGMAIHFPSAMVFADGKIRGQIIPGAKEEPLYEKLIAQELSRN